MNIAFTICSNNYLAQASVLAESFKRFNPEDYFAIILVDELSSEVLYESIAADDIILVRDLVRYNLNNLFDKYDIIELSTAVKPFVFKYFINRFADAKLFYYFDPDIKLYSSTIDIDKQLVTSSMVLTPHIYSPIPMDGMGPQESLFLNHGIYNLGFLGVNSQHLDSKRLLDWWGERTYEIGYSDVAKGLFVDQLWMNFAPLFFSDAKILADRGCNMGPWNLHERSIKAIQGNNIVLDNGDTLKFYHFSSYDYRTPELLSKYYNRYSIESTGRLKELYTQYHNDLVRLNVAKYSSIPYIHGKRKAEIIQPSMTFSQRVKKGIKIVFFND